MLDHHIFGIFNARRFLSIFHLSIFPLNIIRRS